MKILNDKEIKLVQVLQEGLPLVDRPYEEIGRLAGWTEADVIAKLREWRESGVLRRMSAYIRHQRAGYKANGMVVWAVPEDKLEEIGERMTQSPMVSHCYARPASEKFPYRLYTMVHGKEKEEVFAEAERLAALEGLSDYKVLFSTTELKRSTTKLFMEDSDEPQQ